MDRLADRIDQAAAALAMMDRRLPELLPGAADFAADETGRPGRIGRALYAGWSAALSARAREAGQATTKLTEIADAVRSGARAYAETDDLVQRRFQRGL